MMNVELEDQYDEMVGRLAKPADQIMGTLTDSRVNIMHACTGLGGEIGETVVLLLCPPKGRAIDCLLEEAGDLYFYARMLRRELSSVYVPIGFDEVLSLVGKHHPEADVELFRGEFEMGADATAIGYTILQIGTGIAIDAMKRVYIYNGGLDQKFKNKDFTFREAGVDGLQLIEFALGFILGVVGKTREDALRANQEKLDGARYKNGYSDSAAHARADKDDDFDEPLGDRQCEASEDGVCEACQ